MSDLSAPILDRLFKGKASKGYVLRAFFVFYLLTAVIENGPNWINALKKEKLPPPILGDTTQDISETKPEETTKEAPPGNKCVIYSPFENYDVDLAYKFIKQSSGFYVPTGSGKTWEGVVWLNKIIHTNFKSIFIEYEISDEKTTTYPPAITLNIAKNGKDKDKQDIFKVWVPEYSESDGEKYLQLFRIATNTGTDTNQLGKSDSEGLPDSVKISQTDSIKIEVTGVSGNEMGINVTYNYTSNRTGLAIPYQHPFQVKFPLSDLQNSSEQFDLGFGTYVGYKLRVVKLEVCY